ncbi:MAG TPA: glutathione peroxidase [Methylophilaceae bacterium]|jgi:glutathione peroxidase|nr:glutathione peroxidase [Methylophilaceae bacterium]
MNAQSPLLQHTFPRLQDGTAQDLSLYAGKVVLVVNTASYCGLTPQYAGLQKLYHEHKERGFVVLGFPSNEFGAQEPGSEQQIAEFCSSFYHVDFPMFGKTTVTEGQANPFHNMLGAATGDWPKWNFHKYLIARSGSEVVSFPSMVAPDDPALLAAIDRFLDA